ncbi:mCG146267, partial [Mus musculus]
PISLPYDSTERTIPEPDATLLLGPSGFSKTFYFCVQSAFRHISVLVSHHKPVRSELLVRFPLLRSITTFTHRVPIITDHRDKDSFLE